MLLLLEALALLRGETLHVIAFTYGRKLDLERAQQLRAQFDDVIDLSQTTYSDAAKLARAHELAIAVDLDGYTRDSRPQIFVHRAAPIQVNYLGFSGTLGADHIDYIIADRTVIPAEYQKFYTESVVCLPHSYMPRDRRLPIADPGPTREQSGLPATGFVFCCLNGNYKITPDIFADWMTILQEVTGSVLWLRDNEKLGTANLRKHAEKHGVDSNRLVFAQRVPLPDHYARISHADLVLDTPIYNAHTTASDALYAGVPVLTRPGETFASRVAASLLNAIGMPELIVGSRAEYIELAVAIGNDPARIAALKQKLARNRETEPLFDMEAYARHLGAAFEQMVDRHRRGLPPDHIEVAP